MGDVHQRGVFDVAVSVDCHRFGGRLRDFELRVRDRVLVRGFVLRGDVRVGERGYERVRSIKVQESSRLIVKLHRMYLGSRAPTRIRASCFVLLFYILFIFPQKKGNLKIDREARHQHVDKIPRRHAWPDQVRGEDQELRESGEMEGSLFSSFFLSFFLSLETPTGELDLVEDPSASFLLSLSSRKGPTRAFVRSFVRSSVGVVLYPHLSVHR